MLLMRWGIQIYIFGKEPVTNTCYHATNHYFVMNFTLVLFILCVTTLCHSQVKESKCTGANEEYTCGTKCPRSCATLDILIKCLGGCDYGCFCKEGYTRNKAKGECIKPTECPTCGTNETYKPRGYNCPCENHQSVECALLEGYRCYCLPGYVRRDDTGTCVRPQDCPNTRSKRETQCNKPNEEYFPCQPGPCEPTCQHTERGIACAAVCVPDGCRCKQGFLRDANTRECVPEENCP